MPLIGSFGSSSSRGFGFGQGGKKPNAPTVGSVARYGDVTSTTAQVYVVAPADTTSIVSYTAIAYKNGEEIGRATVYSVASTYIYIGSLPYNSTFTFRAFSTSESNINSDLSASNGSFTTAGPPSAPTITSISGVYDTVRVYYNGPASSDLPISTYIATNSTGAKTGYQYRQDKRNGCVEINDLSPGVTYTFKICAQSAGGNSPYSPLSSSYTASAKPAGAVQYLIVGGGGGGGGPHGGGGGGGTVAYGFRNGIKGGSYGVTIGAGGAGVYKSDGTSGTATTCWFSCPGGGGGGGGNNDGGTLSTRFTGAAGGSGGGGAGHSGSFAGGGSSVGGGDLANPGGAGYDSGSFKDGGGGGGALSSGASGQTRYGGSSYSSAISGLGNNIDVGGGGGGGSWQQSTSGTGIYGCSGEGGNAGDVGRDGLSGSVRSGGGGGGGSQSNCTGGNGGSGVVYIRYIPTEMSPTYSGTHIDLNWSTFRVLRIEGSGTLTIPA